MRFMRAPMPRESVGKKLYARFFRLFFFLLKMVDKNNESNINNHFHNHNHNRNNDDTDHDQDNHIKTI